MMPGGSYSLQNSETSSQAGQVEGAVRAGASGGSRGIVNNIAFPGATLEADTGTGGTLPTWLWWVAGGGVALMAFFLLRRK